MYRKHIHISAGLIEKSLNKFSICKERTGMQFYRNTLIQNEDVINVMESIVDNQFDFVYLDVPWLTGKGDFTYYNPEKKEDSFLEIKKYLAQSRNCSVKDITLEEVKEERLKRRAVKERAQIDTYGSFIAKILENSRRILDEKGMLVFKAPLDSIIDYKLMLDQVFSNSYVMQITIEMRKRLTNIRKPGRMNHEILYFYSKSNNYTLNQVYENYDSYKNRFDLKDKRDRYKLYSLMQGSSMARFNYTWRGITPTGNLKWIYKQEKLDNLFKDNRIVIKDNRAYLKRYMKENPREKSSVWKANESCFFDIYEKQTYTMMAQHFIDVVSMVTNENDWIFAPYDVDQKLPVIAQNMNRNWVTVNPFPMERENYKTFLNRQCYEEVSDIVGNPDEVVYSKILKNIDDINDLKARLSTLNFSVADIKKQLGLEGENEETIVEKIQEKIDELIEKSDIEYYIPLVQEWIKPYWDKLEQESKCFLPTAELLFQQYKETKDFDLSTAIMPYCKALEKEIYTKMFKGYVKKLVLDGINVKNMFLKDFVEYETKRFAEAIQRFTTRFKNNDSKWHFELGTMVYILRIVLDDESPFLEKGRIYRDFKSYLEDQFEYSFFNIGFLLKLDNVVQLRNNSAHPQIVTSKRIQEGKEVIKQKIIELLKYYNE